MEKEYKNHAWDRAKKMMANVDQFKNRQARPSCPRKLKFVAGGPNLALFPVVSDDPPSFPEPRSLVAFRGEDITEEEIKKLEPILHEDGFTVDNMKSKSAAAANLCSWVISIYTYNRIYVKVCETSESPMSPLSVVAPAPSMPAPEPEHASSSPHTLVP